MRNSTSPLGKRRSRSRHRAARLPPAAHRPASSSRRYKRARRRAKSDAATAAAAPQNGAQASARRRTASSSIRPDHRQPGAAEGAIHRAVEAVGSGRSASASRSNSLLDEVLTPVDRDVFKRENRYYDALKPDAAGDAAGAGAIRACAVRTETRAVQMRCAAVRLRGCGRRSG